LAEDGSGIIRIRIRDYSDKAEDLAVTDIYMADERAAMVIYMVEEGAEIVIYGGRESRAIYMAKETPGNFWLRVK
jgi:hypothetical protein